MFRRKEDSLFDTATDTNAGPSESATVVTPSSPSSSASSSTSSTAASASAPASPAASTASSSAPASRPAQPTTGFRASGSNLGADLTRGRLPEAKTPASAGSLGSKDKTATGGRRVLTVGNDILLKGEIATCDRLVIEGKVDATLNEVHTVEIAENGSFKGSAQIEDAEISGLFEGELIVRNRLVIYSTGKVRGKISYGEIEIERGGELTGEIKTTSGQSASRPSNRPAGAKEDKNAFAA